MSRDFVDSKSAPESFRVKVLYRLVGEPPRRTSRAGDNSIVQSSFVMNNQGEQSCMMADESAARGSRHRLTDPPQWQAPRVPFAPSLGLYPDRNLHSQY